MTIASLFSLRRASSAVAVALLVAACGSGSATPTPPPAATSQPTAAGASQPAGGGATVSVSGSILVGPTGMALYTKSGDTATSSTCSAGCLGLWPALTVAAGTTPTAGSGAGGTLASFTRTDTSASQVTYNGMPLYYFASDTQAGVASGDGVGGFSAAKP